MVEFTKENTKVSEKNNIVIGSLQAQIDILNSALGTLEEVTDSNIEGIRKNMSSLMDYIDGVISEQGTQELRIEALSSIFTSLQSELELYINNNKNRIDTEVISAAESILSATGIIENIKNEYLQSDEIDTSKITTKELIAESFDVEDLTVKTAKAERLESERISSNELEAEKVITPKITSSKEIAFTGYDSSEYITKVTIKPKSSTFIWYSTDKNFTWTYAWDGALHYNNPTFSLQHIEIANKDSQLFICLYLDLKNKELSSKFLTVGEDEIEINYETVKIPYNPQDHNITESSGSYPGGNGSTNSIKAFIVDELPETLQTNSLYIIPNKHRYFYDVEQLTDLNISDELTVDSIHLNTAIDGNGEWNAGKITSNVGLDIKHSNITWTDKDYTVWLNGEEPTAENFDWIIK